MSVVLEFSIAPGEFRLGEVLAGHEGLQYELERIVPTGEEVLPFVWVTGEEQQSFECAVRSHDAVAELSSLDRPDDRGLYRIEWTQPSSDLLATIDAADGTVLRARGDAKWVFQVRFANHDRLSAFHADVRERGIPIEVDRTISLAEVERDEGPFDLTGDQREALRLALEEGYFATPRVTNLEDLVDRLDISRQAMSRRIRRGNEKILRRVFPSVGNSAGDGH